MCCFPPAFTGCWGTELRSSCLHRKPFATELPSQNLLSYNLSIDSLLSVLCCCSFSEPVFFALMPSQVSVACDIARAFCFCLPISNFALFFSLYSQCHLQILSSPGHGDSQTFLPKSSHHALYSDLASISTASWKLFRSTDMHLELDA